MGNQIDPKTIPFENSKFLDVFEPRLNVFLDNDNVDEAKRFLSMVHSYMRGHASEKTTPKPAWLRLQRMQARAKWVVFATLSDREQIAMLRSSVRYAFSLPELQLRMKLRASLIAKLSLQERDQLKQAMRQALLSNSEPMEAKDNVERNAQGTVRPKTIGGWLRSYNILTNGRVGTSLQRAQFLKGKITTGLSNGDQEQLTNLVNILDYLKLSSVKLESDLEQLSVTIEGVPHVWQAGELTPVAAATDVLPDILRVNGEQSQEQTQRDESISLKNDVVVKPRAGEQVVGKKQVSVSSLITTAAPKAHKQDKQSGMTVPRKTSAKVEPRILDEKKVTDEVSAWEQSNFDSKRVRDFLYNAIHKKHRTSVLAGFVFLAKQNQLLPILVADRRFYDLLANYLKQTHQNAILQQLAVSAADPRLVKLLVRHVLERVMKMAETDAAAVGVVLVELLQQHGDQLNPWAYVDETDSHYYWT